MEWLQVTVSTTGECSELVAMTLYDEGSEGVLIKDDADIRELIEKKLNWDYVDESLLRANDNKALVSGFFPVGFDTSGIHAALDELKKNSAFPTGSLEISVNGIDSADWENEWRKYYAPIEIGKVVIVPAWQSAPDNGEIPVFIEPGMAFGTGNHETTYLMISEMLKLDLEGKELLDMGCGTAVLAILARLKGAKRVAAIDIDEWAYNNALENIRLNHTEDIQVALGGAEKIKEFGLFDIVFANINRNILLNDICQYTNSMKQGSILFMSGFYVEDIPAIEAECQKNGLKLDSYNERNNWVAVKVLKG